MIKANYEEQTLDSKTQVSTSIAPTLTREEILGNSFIFFFGGHETTANNIHFSILLLDMNMPIQRRMQADIDRILFSRDTSGFPYQQDMPRLYKSIVGAIFSEELGLIPAMR